MCEGALTPWRAEVGTLWMYRMGGGLRYSLISESEEAYPQRKKCSVPARHKKLKLKELHGFEILS